MREEIMRIAQEEIRSATFGTTKQYLEVLSVQTIDFSPIVSRVKIDEPNNAATVYFPVEGENFFIAVYLDLGDQIEIRSVETEAGSWVYLSLGTKNITGVELRLTPDKIFKDFTIYGIDIDEPDFIESKISKLLDYLEPFKYTIIDLSAVNSATINIQYFGYKDQMWGMHLDIETMRRIVNLNLELDLDIYAEGKRLNG